MQYGHAATHRIIVHHAALNFYREHHILHWAMWCRTEQCRSAGAAAVFFSTQQCNTLKSFHMVTMHVTVGFHMQAQSTLVCSCSARPFWKSRTVWQGIARFHLYTARVSISVENIKFWWPSFRPANLLVVSRDEKVCIFRWNSQFWILSKNHSKSWNRYPWLLVGRTYIDPYCVKYHLGLHEADSNLKVHLVWKCTRQLKFWSSKNYLLVMY